MNLKERLIKVLNAYGVTNASIIESILEEVNYRPKPGYYWDNVKGEPCEVDEFGINYLRETEVYPFTSETSLRKL